MSHQFSHQFSHQSKVTSSALTLRSCPVLPPQVWAATEFAEKELGWRAKLTVKEMCRDQWAWVRRTRQGVGGRGLLGVAEALPKGCAERQGFVAARKPQFASLCQASQRLPAALALYLASAGQPEPRRLPHGRQRGGAEDCQREGPALNRALHKGSERSCAGRQACAGCHLAAVDMCTAGAPLPRAPLPAVDAFPALTVSAALFPAVLLPISLILLAAQAAVANYTGLQAKNDVQRRPRSRSVEVIARHSGWPLRAVPSWPPAAKGLWCEVRCRHRVLQISKQLPHGDGVRVGLRQREICRWGPQAERSKVHNRWRGKGR